MNIFTSKKWDSYWKDRKIDWKVSYGNWDHPHRFALSAVLKQFEWYSLFEIGCGAGANLINIIKHFPNKQLGGTDINSEAITTANKLLTGAYFRNDSMDDIMMSDNSVDVILTDMALIYAGPQRIEKTIKEIKRITRKRVVLCEFHSSSLWKRILLKLRTGYNSYNYKRLLEKHDFYDIMLYKIPPELWPGGEPQKTFGYILTAKIAK